MPRKPNPTPTDAEQSKRFIETATALEVGKTDQVFKRVIDILTPRKTPTKHRKKSLGATG